MNFDQLIRFAVEQNASDLHFQTGAAPLLRINGQIRTVESPPLTNEDLRQFILSLRPRMTADELDLQLVAGPGFLVLRPRAVAVPGATCTATWARRRWSCGSSS